MERVSFSLDLATVENKREKDRIKKIKEKGFLILLPFSSIIVLFTIKRRLLRDKNHIINIFILNS
jgi:hypothetical protein